MFRRVGIIPLIAVLIAGISGARLVHEWSAHAAGAAECCHTGGAAGDDHCGNGSERGDDGDRTSCPTCDLLAVTIGAASSDVPLTAAWTNECVGATEELDERAPALAAPPIVRARPPPVG